MKLTGLKCECTACLRVFGGEGAFDLHRVGDFYKPGIQANTRRCMTDEEMLDIGLIEKEGVWRRAYGTSKRGRKGTEGISK